jgi:lipoyl(octanoyl) transferase
MDLAPFSWIHPCGYEGLATVDMRELGINAELRAVQAVLTEKLRTSLSRQLESQ